MYYCVSTIYFFFITVPIRTDRKGKMNYKVEHRTLNIFNVVPNVIKNKTKSFASMIQSCIIQNAGTHFSQAQLLRIYKVGKQLTSKLLIPHPYFYYGGITFIFILK